MDQVLADDFVARATAWLDANAQRKPIASDTFVWGQGDDNIRLMGSDHPGDEAARQKVVLQSSARTTMRAADLLLVLRILVMLEKIAGGQHRARVDGREEPPLPAGVCF